MLLLSLKRKQEEIYKLQSGMGQPHVYAKDLKRIKIPLPPLSVQEEVVAEIGAEQKVVNTNKELIKKMERKIEAKINRVWGN